MCPVYAVTDPVFQPAMRIVTAITREELAAVTTSFDHNYITGEIVRLYISPFEGMQQANQLTGTIVVTGPTTFTITIDTTNFDIFAVPNPLPYGYYPSQVVPIGEVNEMLLAATKNVL